MKTIKYLFGLLFTLCLFSCEKEASDPSADWEGEYLCQIHRYVPTNEGPELSIINDHVIHLNYLSDNTFAFDENSSLEIDIDENGAFYEIVHVGGTPILYGEFSDDFQLLEFHYDKFLPSLSWCKRDSPIFHEVTDTHYCVKQ